MNKKLPIFVLALSSVMTLQAQNNTSAQSKYYCEKPKPVLNENPANSSYFNKPTTPDRVSNKNAACEKSLGSSGNAYGGFTRPGRPILEYNPALNTVIFTHRSNPLVDGTATTGALMVDISKDGGSTWEINQGPIFDPAGPELGRYPMGFIYNPSGNTTPDNAFVSVHGASTDGSNWVAHVSGTAPVSDLSDREQTVQTFINSGFQGLIPDAGCITDDGTIWISDWAYDGTDYADTIFVKKGVFNSATGKHEYSMTKVYFPVSLDPADNSKFFVTSNIAFSKNGQVGYLTVSAHSDFTFAPSLQTYLHVWKTTDAGATWSSAPYQISSDVNTLMGTSGVTYNTAFQLDGVVDANNNLHIVVGYAPQSTQTLTAITTAAGTHGLFSVVTNGVDTENKSLIVLPMTFRGTFGGINDDSRAQIAINPAGTNVHYVWFDTDTVLFSGLGNIAPDAWFRTYNVTTNTWGPATNLTAGTVSDARVTFAYVAQYTGSCGTSDRIHIGFQTLTQSDTDPVELHYIDMCCILASNEEKLLNSDLKVFPNPSNGLVNLSLNSKFNGNMTVRVFNINGQEVFTRDMVKTSAEMLINFDLSGLSKGMYLVQVMTPVGVINQKITLE
jgi:hypothetical protein